MPSCTSIQPATRLITSFFFFNDTATTEIYTLSLHDALPILPAVAQQRPQLVHGQRRLELSLLGVGHPWSRDRKSTRLNSSHVEISYAVFCLKKKKVWQWHSDQVYN